MNQCENPIWWDASHDFAWDHVKRAMKHQWNQTKQDSYSDSDVYTKGEIAFNQITGEPIVFSCEQSTFEELEFAYRFGYGARIEYSAAYPHWDDDLEIRLARDWQAMNPNRHEMWENDRGAIHYGWDFEEKEAGLDDEGEEWKRN